jgi:hypothetical protein
MNDLFKSIANIEGITHVRTIPYSKEENGLVERANKEINRYLRNIMFDRNIYNEWSDYIPLIEKLFNSSTKETTGLSPNQIIFGNSIDTRTGIIHDIDKHVSNNKNISMRQYIDKLLSRQQKLIVAAQLSIEKLEEEKNKQNNLNLLKRKPRKPPQINPTDLENTTLRRSTRLITNHINIKPLPNPTNRIYQWIRDPTSSEPKWIKTSNTNEEELNILKTIQKNRQEITRHQVDDYVLLKHPPTLHGSGPPNKYASFWRGPYLVKHTDDHNLYKLQNLVTGSISEHHVTQLKPFYYDPKFVQPLNIAARDHNEYIVESILDHRINDDHSISLHIAWEGYDDSFNTWEPIENFLEVEKFHDYCKIFPELSPRSQRRQKLPRKNKRRKSDKDA